MMIRRLCQHVRHTVLSSKFQSVRVKRESLASLGTACLPHQCLSTVAPLGQEDVLTRELKSKYDAIVIGAGHNGLVAASYLQKAGYDVCVLEKRYVIGGAAVTEEIIPGFKFSRASYLLSLLRPHIFEDLKLKEHRLKVHLRQPDSYTPLHESCWKNSSARSLTLGRDPELNHQQISQFSKRDAESYKKYEAWLGHLVSAIDPLLNTGPVNSAAWLGGSLKDKARNYTAMKALVQTGRSLGKEAASFYELMTAPASKVLERWFESEPLKATLATDSVIGAMASPKMPGSGYVLLHHVFGELEGIKGAWGYVEGGMGGVSLAIARCAHAHGASIFVDKSVSEIVTDSQGKATGVVLEDGTEIQSKMVLSCATPKITFLNLVPKGVLPKEFVKDISLIDYTSPVTKINVAVNKLPNFTANPNPTDGSYLPHHQCTIHLNCEDSEIINEGYMDATRGHYSRRPMIEMTIPSTLDRTIAPPGCHVVLLFTQYTPFTLADGKQWDEPTKDEYADLVFDTIEQYAPGFKESVVGRDILTPPDLEKLIGLTGGNIFHGSMSLDQLYLSRPLPSYCDYRSPIPGLYLCGSGAHPGGGVMGEAGHQAAMAAMQDF